MSPDDRAGPGHNMAADPASREAAERAAREHLIQPWEGMQNLGENVRTLVSGGEGVYLTDAEGARLIDGPGGMWCLQLGHGNREIAEAAAAQMTAMPYNSPWNTTSAPAARLAERIAALAPGDLNHVFFTTGGSTAVDSALRFMHMFNNALGRPRKKRIIARKKGYHGSTYLSASASGKERDKTWFDFAGDVTHISAPHALRRPEGVSKEGFLDWLADELEQTIADLGPENVGAFIAEPVLASGGVIVPPEGYHKRTLEICRRHDILYISDEVVTAFGRLGHWFASEDVFDITPDIITFAKGVTSGYLPLGGFAVSDSVLARLKGRDAQGAQGADVTFSNGYTHSGHPVCCAVALKNIEIIERDGVLAHVRDVGPYFQARLRELEDLPIVTEVRGMGLMGGVECAAEGDPRETLETDHAIGARIDAHCQRMGLIVRPIVNLCVMSPPLIITREQIDTLADILRRGVEAAQKDLEAEGLWRAS